MSHFTRLHVKISDAQCLVAALGTLGFEAELLHEPIFLRGYLGGATKQRVNVILRREKMGQRCSDIGWMVENGEAECHADEYHNARVQALGGLQNFFQKVAQEYSVETIKKQARASGQIATRVNDPKTGKVRVLVGC
jgi:hypothetical protein